MYIPSRSILVFCMTIALLVTNAPLTHAQTTAVDVCIDPGHGGSDVGAINEVDGVTLREVDINLEVSKRLAEQLATAGYSYYFTWHTDPTLPTASRDGNSNGRERAKICNSVNARVVVSVHTNSVADASRDGVWMGYHGSESRLFAENMLALTWRNLFTNEGAFNNGDWNDENIVNYGIEVFANSLLIHTDMPAIIFEPVFMSDDASRVPEFHALLTTIYAYDADGSYTYVDGKPLYNADCDNGCRRQEIAFTLYQGVEAELLRLGGDTNVPPVASFRHSCSDLTCVFTDSSTDSDGAISSWHWDFGDGAASIDQHPSHSYSASGTFTVGLTVTDNEGATDSTSQDVTVSAPSTGGITLTATGYKVQGNQKAYLSWSGATSTTVDIFRDGANVATVANNGEYTDNIDQKGRGSYIYKVCEAGASTCSNPVTVTF